MPTDIQNATTALNNATTEVKNLNATVNGKIAQIDAKVAAKEKEIDGYMENARHEQTHIRLSRNQRLSRTGNNIQNWTMGFTKKWTFLETVSSGVDPKSRTTRAREFLKAISMDVRHFTPSSFHIWELEFYPNRRGSNSHIAAYGMFQHIHARQYISVGAIVKHIKGVVPKDQWCYGLKAGEHAKLCIQHFDLRKGIGYTHIHAHVPGENLSESQTSVIQVALPAAVTGYIDPAEKYWGEFPLIGTSYIND